MPHVQGDKMLFDTIDRGLAWTEIDVEKSGMTPLAIL